MKRFRLMLCVILTFSMLLSICACTKKQQDISGDTAVQTPPVNTPETDIEAEAENTPALNMPDLAIPDTDPDERLKKEPFVLIKDVEEVLARPRGIQPGTSLTFCSNDVPSYVPWNSTAELWLHQNIYEGLVYCYMGKPDDIRPLIAESYTHSEDYLTWVFQIREGITFTDGTVCDAEAVSSAWSYYYEVSPGYLENLNIISWEATAPMEFTVKLSAPCAYIANGIAELYILSPAALGEFGVNNNRAAVGTAPYYVSEYDRGDGFVFRANENYYLYERYPVIETINYKIFLSMEKKSEAFLTGELDGFSFSRSNWENLEYDVYAELYDVSKYDATVLRSYQRPNPIWINSSNTPEFQIHEVRKAINRFIDLDKVNEDYYYGLGKVQTSIWSAGSSSEVPWPEGFYYDADEGLALLAQAGIAPQDLVFESYALDTLYAMYESIASQLAGVGITFKPKLLEPELSYFASTHKDNQFVIQNPGFSDAEPYLPWDFILLPEHFNRLVFVDSHDPDLYTALCDTYWEMLSAATWDEMLDNAKSLTDMVQKDYTAMPGVQSPWCGVFRKDIKGIVLVTDMQVLLWNYLYL